MAGRIILRYPDGSCTLEYDKDDTHIVQNFINWVIAHNHYLDYDEQKCEFSFENYKFVSICKVKWRKLGLSCV